MLTREQIGNNIYVVFPLSDQTASLDKVSVMMINNNQQADIGLAPIRFDGKNGTCSRMMFDVTGKVTLREYISKNISQNDFKQMLTNLINALENFDEVMIDSKQVILNLDSVFINILNHSVSFLCVALKNQSRNGSLVTFFKEIVENSFVTAGFNEASYFNRVYNVVHTENGFSLQNLRAAMNDTAVTPTTPPPSNQQSIQKQRVIQPVQPARVEEPETITVSPSTQVQQPVAPIQPMEPEEKKKGLFGGLFSSTKKKKSDSAVTGYQGGLAGLMNGSKSSPTIPTAPTTTTQPPIQQPYQKPTQGSGQFDFGGTTVLSSGMANAPKNTIQKTDTSMVTPVSQPIGTTVLDKTSSVQNGYVGTTVLNPGLQASPGTTVLNPQSVKKGAIIQLRTRERYFIRKSPFMIGRDTPGADCDIHDNTNVGHRHASIIQRDTEFFVIDQHSTNHTYLNGVMITCGVETRLSDGDRLKFADEEFEFRIM